MAMEFQVKTKDFGKCRLVAREDRALGEGEVRLKVDVFSFTANNITYAAAGYSLGYWKFFPASDNEGGEWGIIPVWSMADVVESNHPEVPVGDRLFGYFPPASDMIMQPTNVTAGALFDATEHRQELPPLYNRYSRVLASSEYSKNTDVARVLLGPLHMTSFALWDQLNENDYYGARQALIVSASSKTSLGLAHGLSQRNNNIKVVGLTSARNVDFVKGTGLYDQVISYDDLQGGLVQIPSVTIDMAGNADVKAKIKHRLDADLKFHIQVGITHWEDLVRAGAFNPEADPTKEDNFFAPGYILERMKEIGAAEFDAKAGAYMQASAKASFNWMTVDQKNGLEEFESVYPTILNGSLPPDTGIIVKV